MTDTLTITDNRSGEHRPGSDRARSAIRATALKELGLASYDPAFLNTASVTSAITFIDGDAGILRYRGYPIEQLATESTYLETAYLLIHGELPTDDELHAWSSDDHAPHVPAREPQAAHGGLSLRRASDGDARSAPSRRSRRSTRKRANVDDEATRMAQVVRLIAKVPTIAAFSYRHSRGLPYVYPDNELGFTENFLSMMFRMAEPRYSAEPALIKALDVLFILHADHEQNCSANVMRSIGSSKADPYSALAGAAAALYGPLHGGANEAVLRMLAEIGDVKRIPDFIARVKAGEGRLMGFGHRVYKNYDPRAKIIKETADAVFEVTGRNRAARHRARAREDRARGRVLRQPQALPERRLLLGDHLPGARPADRDVPGHVRDPAHGRLACAVARGRRRPRAEDRPAAAAVRRRGRARLRRPRLPAHAGGTGAHHGVVVHRAPRARRHARGARRTSGVDSIGDLRALRDGESGRAKFCLECGAPLAAPGAAGEVRKTVTVVFCDITGSTALGESTDPESLRAVLARYFERMKAIVERHGGTVEKFIGDAVMAVFGVPVLHEDDALRALRAAAEMRDALPALGVQARIGVNTGEVVTGTGERLVTGDAVNVAARLEQAAPPGEVLSARRRCSSRATRSTSSRSSRSTLKGKSRAGRGVPARRGHAARRDRAHASTRRWSAASASSAACATRSTCAVADRACQLFTLLGAAGVGKSRLVARVPARRRRDASCAAAASPTARASRTGRSWRSLKQLGRRRELDPRVAEPLASLLGDERRRVERRRSRWAVRKLLEEAARERPLVVVFDDLHWARGRRSSTSSSTSPTGRATRRSCCSAWRGRSCSTGGPAGPEAS